ncbi:MAG: sulfatase-like hydrolase/transferase, partial [Candidatus Hydrogenedentes bacterium]|nr:sulfatase-like hydrolase/transferase [Candidatus Hydrogenedentota bacterium]
MTAGKPWKGLIALWGVHAAGSVLFAVVLDVSFASGKHLILAGPLLVSGIFLGFSLLLGLAVRCRAFRERWFARYAIAVVCATGTSLLVLLYITDYVCNAAWGGNATLDLILVFAPQLSVVARSLGLPAAALYLAIAGMIVPVFVAYLCLSNRLFEGLQAAVRAGGPYSLFRDRRRGRLSTAALTAGTAVLLSVAFVSMHWLGAFWQGDPIVGLFQSRRIFQSDPRGKVLPVEYESALAMRNYPLRAPSSQMHIIIIVVDSLRADHMGVYGYERPTTPFLSRMVAEGRMRQVRAAMAPYACSLGAAFALLTSRADLNLGKELGY